MNLTIYYISVMQYLPDTHPSHNNAADYFANN
jgi:hypothetical protein